RLLLPRGPEASGKHVDKGRFYTGYTPPYKLLHCLPSANELILFRQNYDNPSCVIAIILISNDITVSRPEKVRRASQPAGFCCVARRRAARWVQRPGIYRPCLLGARFHANGTLPGGSRHPGHREDRLSGRRLSLIPPPPVCSL